MALDTNILAYWKLDESSGNPADATGNGYTLTNNGSVPFSSSYGLINNGASFNGSSQNLYSTDAGLAQTSFSISLWANFQATSSTYYLASRLAGGSTGNNKQFYIIWSGGTWTVGFWNGSYYQLTYSNTPTTGTWHHYVLTFDASTYAFIFYIDGVAVASGTSTFLPADGGTQAFTVGSGVSTASPAAFGSWFNGYIDEVGYWSRALSSTEVSTLYNSGAGLQYPFSTTPAYTPSPISHLIQMI